MESIDELSMGGLDIFAHIIFPAEIQPIYHGYGSEGYGSMGSGSMGSGSMGAGESMDPQSVHDYFQYSYDYPLFEIFPEMDFAEFGHAVVREPWNYLDEVYGNPPWLPTSHSPGFYETFNNWAGLLNLRNIESDGPKDGSGSHYMSSFDDSIDDKPPFHGSESYMSSFDDSESYMSSFDDFGDEKPPFYGSESYMSSFDDSESYMSSFDDFGDKKPPFYGSEYMSSFDDTGSYMSSFDDSSAGSGSYDDSGSDMSSFDDSSMGQGMSNNVVTFNVDFSLATLNDIVNGLAAGYVRYVASGAGDAATCLTLSYT